MTVHSHMKLSRITLVGMLLLCIGIILLLIWGFTVIGSDSIHPPMATASLTPTQRVDLLIPTRTNTPSLSGTATSGIPTATTVLATVDNTPSTPMVLTTSAPAVATSTSTATPTQEPPKATITPELTVTTPQTPGEVTTTPSVFMIPRSDIYRIGVSLPYGATMDYRLRELGVGWVMDWNAYVNTFLPEGVEFVQTVRMRNGQLTPNATYLAEIAAAHRGATWLMSNEPDVRWQDNVTPETYATLYYDAYRAILDSDPTAKIAVGGIAQPTNLRLEYLDRILAAYQSMYGEPLPAQAWHIHNYMLHEERDTWGVDIPPGLSNQQGMLYSIDDSGNLAAFKSQIYNFRSWMAKRGYRHLPLIISEFGIPMPPDYGFDEQRVSKFLRVTWQFLYTATDSGIGLPADNGRLVQRWCWFSIGVEGYPAGNLLNPPAGEWTSLGLIWQAMVEQ
jgi:hypothetical protein